MTDARSRHRSIRGFTLVEYIVVILIIGVLAAISAVFIVQPFEAARDTTRRAELVDAAETALNRMTREIRLAVPNSVRINAGANALEFLRTTTGGRYRRLLDGDGNGNVLDPTVDASEQPATFDVLGGLPDPDGDVAANTRSAGRDCAEGSGYCIVINNTGPRGTDFDAYDTGNNVAAITATSGLGDSDRTNDTLTFDTGGAGAAAAFPAHSASQRFQVMDTAVTYVCTGSRIDRHHDYGLKDPQEAQPGGTVSELARDVVDCEFTYDDGAGQRHGLVTIDITIQRDGETVRLVDQAHVVNVP
ncbi:type II secretion system protein [Halofilum ochraceum]|uniref:type II secretion system protein n=1 Tax=Halofilum ochraceum TaxID=1611323 RepID=UPI0008D9BD25|nr:prepilin-type N-terminal cleavage/methylation domain-containing protein [Halofilum ochraceum]